MEKKKNTEKYRSIDKTNTFFTNSLSPFLISIQLFLVTLG